MLQSIALSTFITLGGWSTHFKPGYDLCYSSIPNEPCIKMEYNYNHNILMIDYNGLTAGTFKNSYFSKSNLIGYTYRYDNFSILAAASTGYERGNRCAIDLGKYCAVIALSYSYRPLKITLLGEALAVSIEFKIF